MKTVAVFGANGYLGRHLCRYFEEHGVHCSRYAARDAKRRALAEKPNDKEIPHVFSVEGHIDGEDFVPVRFGLKYSATGKATLYVVVDQNIVRISELDEIKKARVIKPPVLI